MIRSLLALLAILVTGLAILFNRPWLNVVTALILVGAVGLLGWWLWTTFWTEEPERPRPTPEPEDDDASLEEFGIVDIQPQGASAAGANEDDPAPESDRSSSPPSGAAPAGSNPATAPPPSARDEDTANDAPADTASPSTASDKSEPHDEAPVLGPLLASLRAAIDARTVCLLVQEEVALTYRIDALASTSSAVEKTGTFDTQTPLLTATMSRQSVTVRSIAQEEVAVEDLGYYSAPPAVEHLAVAPVSRPDESSTTFLMADAPADVDLGSSRTRTLLEHFAETVSLLLSTDRSGSATAEDADRDDHLAGQAPEAATGDSAASPPDGDDAPRPRRELIAEEMEAVQADEENLALALVHLNRAESIARRGEEAVATAERLFQARLEQLAPHQRVERFGELTYGIFFRDGAEAIEPQVADLETTMAQEEGELEGGVSVGVAVWNGEEPEALRTEATEALREAYETGTPTIVT